MTYENLKAYIQKVYELESSLYQQRQLGRQLQYEINIRYNYSGDTRPFKKTEYEVDFLELFKGSLGFAMLGGIIGIVLACDEIGIVPTNLWIAFPIFGLLLLPIWGLYTFYTIKHSNAEVDRENKEIAKHNAQLCTKMRKQADVIQTELDQVNNSIAQTLHTLDIYYQMNIIAPKYQHNLIAISSFHEYLTLERTHSLTFNPGDSGAYNIYENELRLNVIIGKLDDIIDRLDQIKSKQYSLYQAIQSSNRTSNQILQATRQSSQRLEAIENNSVISAYNSVLTESNTRYLKWAEMFK